MDAYRQTIEYVKDQLHILAKDLVEHDNKLIVFVAINYNFMVILKGENKCTVGFEDVPYRWYLNVDIPPSKKSGSSITLKEAYFNRKEPIGITIEEIDKALENNKSNTSKSYYEQGRFYRYSSGQKEYPVHRKQIE